MLLENVKWYPWLTIYFYCRSLARSYFHAYVTLATDLNLPSLTNPWSSATVIILHDSFYWAPNSQVITWYSTSKYPGSWAHRGWEFPLVKSEHLCWIEVYKESLHRVLGTHFSQDPAVQHPRSICVCACVLTHVQLIATPWTVIHQAPLSMGFSKQASWSGLPVPTPEDLLDPGIKCASPALAGRFFTTEPFGNPF